MRSGKGCIWVALLAANLPFIVSCLYKPAQAEYSRECLKSNCSNEQCWASHLAAAQSSSALQGVTALPDSIGK